MSVEVQELAARYGAAWAKHDLDAIIAMHTEDPLFHLHGAPNQRSAAQQYARHSPPGSPNGPISTSSESDSTSARDTS
jgi:hypothetical protein